MINPDNKALCPAPWVSLYFEPNGIVDNCCVGKNRIGNIQDNTIQEIVFGEKNRNVQQQMLDGVYPSGCKWCVNKSHSLQDLMWRNYPSRAKEDYRLGDFKLQYLDARWSNTCNLACVYCGPTLSSTWAQEIDIAVRIEKQYKNDLLDYVLANVENLKQVYLAGGEPMLMKENELLIEAIKNKNPNCYVLVNTNLTQIENNSIFNNLLELKNLEWLISMDDREERFEYLRYPAKWNVFEKNLMKLKSLVPVHTIKFNMVFTGLNALTIWDTADWLLDQGFMAPFNISLYNNGVVTGPTDIRNFSVEYQQQVLTRMSQEKYKNFDGWNNVFDYVSVLGCNPSNQSKIYLRDMDQRRDLDCSATFPLAYPYLK